MIAWARRQDDDERLSFLPYQEAPEPPMTEALRTRCERAMHVVTPHEEILRAGRASLWILEELGFRRIAGMGRVPPIVWAVELGYWIVARNRQFFGTLSTKREDR